jgi:hypothetical protein
MAIGSYVWILSPDDRLRNRYIVEGYVRVMEANRHVGYAFCPAHIVQDGRDLGLFQESVYGSGAALRCGFYSEVHFVEIEH